MNEAQIKKLAAEPSFYEIAQYVEGRREALRLIREWIAKKIHFIGTDLSLGVSGVYAKVNFRHPEVEIVSGAELGGPAGVYYPDEHRVMLADSLESVAERSRVWWHELGHAARWRPEDEHAEEPIAWIFGAFGSGLAGLDGAPAALYMVWSYADMESREGWLRKSWECPYHVEDLLEAAEVRFRRIFARGYVFGSTPPGAVGRKYRDFLQGASRWYPKHVMSREKFRFLSCDQKGHKMTGTWPWEY